MNLPHHRTNTTILILLNKSRSLLKSSSLKLKKCNTSQLVIFIFCLIILYLIISGPVYRDNYESTKPNYYIFGYGSLINKESRKETGITGDAIPVRVHHLNRGWIYDVDTYHHPKLSNTPFTAVGVQISKHYDSTVNGVIFPLQYDEIDKYDQREARYKRYQLVTDDIEILGSNINYNKVLDTNPVIYVYVVPNHLALSIHNTTKRILKQSYIDKFLSGCFDVNGFSFALECVQTTTGWNGKYQNDRHQSLFSRNKISKDTKQQIDDLIDSRLPSLRK